MFYASEQNAERLAKRYAIIYTRVSSGRQVENASLDTQEQVCKDYCARQGWAVLRVFREEGESAKTADRTQLQQALNYCRENRPRPAYFVVYDVKRFARDCEDHDALRRTLTNWDIFLRAATQNIGERPEERFLERILSGEAEYDNAVRKQRTIGGMTTRLNQGMWTFKAPLGFLNEKKRGIKTIVPDPDRAPLIRKAFQRFGTGLYKRQAVLEWVNDQGLRTWQGKRLSTETFRRMLSNPLYAGRIVVQGKKAVQGTTGESLKRASLNQSLLRKFSIKYKHYSLGGVHLLLRADVLIRTFRCVISFAVALVESR